MTPAMTAADAQVLRTAGSHSPAAAEAVHSFLRMAVGGEVMAVPIGEVREILEVGRLTPLPRTPAFVRGVMNLRGAVVPVIDLAARVGGAPITLGRRSCIVVVESDPVDSEDASADDQDQDDGSNDSALVVGLLVDAVFEVFDSDATQVEPVPSLGTRVGHHFLACMTRARNEVVGVLALSRVLARHELTELIVDGAPH